MRSEARVREDVDPGKRRLPIALEDDDVLAAVGREAAEAVPQDERGRLDGVLLRPGRGGSPARKERAWGRGSGSGRSSWLARLPRSPARTARATAWRRMRSRLRHPSPRRRNTPPGRPLPGAPGARLDELARAARAARRGSSAGARSGSRRRPSDPSGASSSCAFRTCRDERSTSSGYATCTRTIGRSPEMPCAQSPGWPSEFRARVFSSARERGVREEDARGEPLEELGLLGGDAEVPERDLGVRVGEREGAGGDARSRGTSGRGRPPPPGPRRRPS